MCIVRLVSNSVSTCGRLAASHYDEWIAKLNTEKSRRYFQLTEALADGEAMLEYWDDQLVNGSGDPEDLRVALEELSILLRSQSKLKEERRKLLQEFYEEFLIEHGLLRKED